MREPQIDDLVIHINEGNLVGWSYVSTPFSEVDESPPSPGQWAGRASRYYRVNLKEYQEFPKSVALTQFIARNRSAIERELKNDAPKRYLFIFSAGKNVRHAQGAYLTRCTPKLYALIRNEVFAGTAEVIAQSSSGRYWAMALGEGGRLSG